MARVHNSGTIARIIARELRSGNRLKPDPAPDTTKAPEGGLGSSADADTHRATEKAVVGGPLSWGGFHDALKATAKEYSAISWSGFNVFGDEKSIREVSRLIHEEGNITAYWRPEVLRQREIIARQQTATRDDTQPGTEKPSGFGVNHENHEALREKVARTAYRAHVMATNAARPEGERLTRMTPEMVDGWFDLNAEMPMSGPGFSAVWLAVADAILAALQSGGES